MMKRSNIMSISASLAASVLLAAYFVVGCSSSSSSAETDSSTTDAQAETQGTGGSAGNNVGDAASDVNVGDGGGNDVQPQEGGDTDVGQPEGGEDVASDVEKKLYGKIQTIKFLSTFIYESTKLEDDIPLVGQEYIGKNDGGVQRIPAAFVGVYDGDNAMSIPPEANSTIAVAISMNGNLQVLQQSAMTTQKTSEVDPRVVLSFKAVSKIGELTIDTSDGSASLWLSIKDPNDEYNKRCVVAVGYGKFNLEENSNLWPDPARLKLSGKDIELYVVTDTPDGDISSKIKGLTGLEACK